MYNTSVVEKGPVAVGGRGPAAVGVAQQLWAGLCAPPPGLYQRVGLGVGVVALFQVSSGVQQRLLGGAELGSLCLD